MKTHLQIFEVNNEFMKSKSKVSCDELLDLDLNMNELMELLNMAIRPWVRRTIVYNYKLKKGNKRKR